MFGSMPGPLVWGLMADTGLGLRGTYVVFAFLPFLILPMCIILYVRVSKGGIKKGGDGKLFHVVFKAASEADIKARLKALRPLLRRQVLQHVDWQSCWSVCVFWVLNCIR